MTIDWEGALWDCIGHLQALIRMDTVNPPGNEMGLARYLDDVLRGAGIETSLFEPAAGRAVLVGRITGTGKKRPLLLLAHMDVVAVEREKWRTNPFGAEILDGFVYGRGAIDDKGMLAVHLQTMLLVQEHITRAGGQLDRDLVMVATADEETGGALGIRWLVRNHPELLDAEFALNEGGRIRVNEGQTPYCAVQCAEKVAYLVRVTARGPSGHAAIPLRENAIAHLARAVSIVAAHEEPIQLDEITRRFVASLAADWPDAHQRAALTDIASDDPERVNAAARVLAELRTINAVLRNGISPTIISGGIKANVIPADATATLNIRVLPGQRIDDVLDRLRTAVHDDAIEFEVTSRGENAPASPVDSPMYRAIEDSVRALDSTMRTTPYLSTGATDSAALRQLGVHAYGVLPFPLTLDDENRMHGHDERVSVSALGFALRLVYDIVRRVSMETSA